jgi:putative transposase
MKWESRPHDVRLQDLASFLMQTASEPDLLQVSAQRRRPFGEEAWVRRMAKQLRLDSMLCPRGRPIGS